jgi:hypothetical protein
METVEEKYDVTVADVVLCTAVRNELPGQETKNETGA